MESRFSAVKKSLAGGEAFSPEMPHAAEAVATPARRRAQVRSNVAAVRKKPFPTSEPVADSAQY